MRSGSTLTAGIVGLALGLIGSCIKPEVTVSEPEAKPVVIEPSTEPKIIKQDKPESNDGTIIMYTRENCVWCQRWKKAELPKILKATWKYKEVRVSDGPVPRFEVFGRGKSKSHTGYMDMPALRKIVNSL